ncbi:minor tail protein [Mycobacterium phage Pinkcreek]|nr:minor tail protein [Mycobacterium phage Pinkcreek]
MAALSQLDREFVDNVVSEEMAATKQPGMMLKITGPAGDYELTRGLRAVAPDKPMSFDAKFRAASVTKTLTAMAILREVDKGKISLDDVVDKYVAQIPNGRQLTVKQVLMMRSGLAEYQTDIIIALTFLAFPTWPTFSPEGAMQAVRRNKAVFKPGAQYMYCGSNYHLLALILEKVNGGKDWKRILMDDLVKPLGMTSTSFPDGATTPQPEVKGYTTGVFKKWSENGKVNANFHGPAGGMVTTMGDMHKWATAMRDGVFLKPETRQLQRSLFSSVPWTDEGPTAFGYGMGLLSFGKWFGHDGWIPGYGTVAMYEPVSGAVFTGVENMKTPNLKMLSRVFVRVAGHLYPGSMDTPTYSLG